MNEKTEIRDAGSLSVKKLRKSLVEDGWSPDYFVKLDEITTEIKKLEAEWSKLTRMKLKTADPDAANKANEIWRKISELKMQLEEIMLDEEIRVDNLKK